MEKIKAKEEAKAISALVLVDYSKRDCLHCGGSFEPNSRNRSRQQVFCCTSCRMAAWERNKGRERGKKDD